MENLEALLHGFTIALTLPHIVLMIGGVLLGILVGVLPGLGAPNGVSLLLPAVLYVALIPLLGIYAASAAYLFGTLRFQTRLSVVRSLAIALVTAVVLYTVFERLFQISLPHGLLGAMLDL